VFPYPCRETRPFKPDFPVRPVPALDGGASGPHFQRGREAEKEIRSVLLLSKGDEVK